MPLEIACKVIGGVPTPPKNLLKQEGVLILDVMQLNMKLTLENSTLQFPWNSKVVITPYGKMRKISTLKIGPIFTPFASDQEIYLLPANYTCETSLEKIIHFQNIIQRDIDEEKARKEKESDSTSLMSSLVKNVAKGIGMVTTKVTEMFSDLNTLSSNVEPSVGKTVKIDKFETYFNEVNKDAVSSILFVPGIGETMELWSFYSNHFSKSHRVITYDLLGHGKSKPPGAKKYYRLSYFMKQLADLIESLDLSTPLTLVGHSLGGCIALNYALDHPTQVHRLVLLSSMAKTPNFVLKAVKLMPPPILWGPLKNQALNRSPEFLISPTTNPDLAKEFVTAALKTPENVLAASAKGILLNCNLLDRLPTFSVPTLLLRGKQDVLCNVATFQELGSIKYSKSLEIDQAGHLLPLEQSEAVKMSIADFLNEKFPTDNQNR